MSLLYVFTDSEMVIQTWDDFSEMMDGAAACQDGRDIPEQASEAFQYGYAQEYARMEGMSNG